MVNEKGNFRSARFGGFNRYDVAEYIEKLSSERNKYKDKSLALEESVERLQKDVDFLTHRLADTVMQLEEAQKKATDEKIAVIDDTLAAITDFKSEFATAVSKISELSAAASDSTNQLSSYINSLPEKVIAVESQLDELVRNINPLSNEA